MIAPPDSSGRLALLTPAVAFPVTICVLCYGPHCDLAERFLKSIYRCTNPALFELRAGLNEVEPATRRLFDDYAALHGNVHIFYEPRNKFKNPLMRRMFYDPPLATRWVIWCDDDTHFTRTDWLHRLAMRIETTPAVVMFGKIYRLCTDDPVVLHWIREAKWYQHVPFLSGNGDNKQTVEFRFPTGAFWAARTDILRQLEWPDERLIQAYDDFMLGEALRQNHLQLDHFASGVSVNDCARRNSTAPEVNTFVMPWQQTS